MNEVVQIGSTSRNLYVRYNEHDQLHKLNKSNSTLENYIFKSTHNFVEMIKLNVLSAKKKLVKVFSPFPFTNVPSHLIP